jgi:hypothetical protein
MRPGSVPPVDVLTSLPVASMSGACFASDIRGTDRYIYYFAPSSTTAATFWRYDTWANSWTQLASPSTIGGNARFGTGCALVYDSSGASGTGMFMGDPPNVWLFHPHAAAPWAQLQYYYAGDDSWTTVAQGGGAFNAGGLGGAALAAQWSGDAAITHTCSALNSTANDNYLYITGNNATFFYRYSISLDTVAAMGVHGVAAGAGTSLAWIPQIPNRLYYQRGGATVVFEYYDIANNAWVAVNTVPYAETYTTGNGMIGDASRGKFVIRQSAVAGGQIKLYDLDPLVTIMNRVELRQTGSGYLGEGTPHSGMLTAMSMTGTQKYLYIAKYTSTDFQRIWIVE